MKINNNYSIFPIGYITNKHKEIKLNIFEKFRPALKQLDHFSHVMVFWWADRHDNEKSRSIMQTEPPYAKGKITGVFATRAEYRPNPIALTTCKLLAVDETGGIIQVANIDAYDGTAIVDLKGYFPVCDRVREDGYQSGYRIGQSGCRRMGLGCKTVGRKG